MTTRKESTQVIICICNYCKNGKRVSMLACPIESFFCEYCKKDVTDFTTKPVMIPAYEKEYNSFKDG
jgi:hypothetical protein